MNTTAQKQFLIVQEILDKGKYDYYDIENGIYSVRVNYNFFGLNIDVIRTRDLKLKLDINMEFSLYFKTEKIFTNKKFPEFENKIEEKYKQQKVEKRLEKEKEELEWRKKMELEEQEATNKAYNELLDN